SFDCRAFVFRAWRCHTFACGDRKLASALSCFTSEFGMGSGGSHSLWSPGKPVSLSRSTLRRYAVRKVVVAYVCLSVETSIKEPWFHTNHLRLYGQAARPISTG